MRYNVSSTTGYWRARSRPSIPGECITPHQAFLDFEREAVEAFCTYCSNDKDPATGNIPAIDRYRHPRINKVYSDAKSARVQFFILSGKFGLLKPCDQIPNYDHKLEMREVNSHANLVAMQLRRSAISRLVYFAKPLHKNEGLRPY